MSEVYDPYSARPVAANKSAPMREEGTTVGGVAGPELRAFVERIERVHEDKKALSDDEKLIYAELKARGFDPKTVRAVIRLRKKDEHERQEEQAVLDLYLEALGMPLFGGGL